MSRTTGQTVRWSPCNCLLDQNRILTMIILFLVTLKHGKFPRVICHFKFLQEGNNNLESTTYTFKNIILNTGVFKILFQFYLSMKEKTSSNHTSLVTICPNKTNIDMILTGGSIRSQANCGLGWNFPTSLCAGYETDSLPKRLHCKVENQMNIPGFSSFKHKHLAGS